LSRKGTRLPAREADSARLPILTRAAPPDSSIDSRLDQIRMGTAAHERNIALPAADLRAGGFSQTYIQNINHTKITHLHTG
jgi:hypothetical protein